MRGGCTVEVAGRHVLKTGGDLNFMGFSEASSLN